MINDNVLHIEYQTGEMNIVIDKFFPTTIERVKKLSKIIEENVPAEEQKELYRHLKTLLYFYRDEEERYQREVDSSSYEDEAYKEAYKNMKESRRKKEQMLRDINTYIKTTKLEV